MSARPITITTAQLREILAQVSRPQPCSFVALTKPEQKKTPWGTPVYKLAKVNAFICTHYVESVNRQREKAGIDAELPERDHQWATHATSCLLTKPDAKSGGNRYYLAAQIQHHDKVRALYLLPRLRGKRTVLTAVSKDEVSPFLRPERLASAAAGLNRPVVFKNYALESVVALALGGRRYRVRQETTTT